MKIKTGYFYEKASPFLTRFVISCIIVIIICLVYIATNVVAMQDNLSSPAFYKAVDKS